MKNQNELKTEMTDDTKALLEAFGKIVLVFQRIRLSCLIDWSIMQKEPKDIRFKLS